MFTSRSPRGKKDRFFLLKTIQRVKPLSFVIYVQIMWPFGVGYYPAYDYHYSPLPVNHSHLPGYTGKVITFNLAV